MYPALDSECRYGFHGNGTPTNSLLIPFMVASSTNRRLVLCLKPTVSMLLSVRQHGLQGHFFAAAS